MKINALIPLLFIVIFNSCRSSKTTAVTTANISEVKDIIASHDAAAPDFKTLAARVQVIYEDEKKLQSLTVSLRMEKDQIIWIKASILGITLAKILITPDSVSYYESITNTYFEGDFALLSDVLGTEVDFMKTQDILLGQSIFSLESSDYNANIVLNKYKLIPKKQGPNFIHSILLNSENYKVNTETLSQPKDSRLLSVRYGEYRVIDGGFYPSKININATENESKTKIDLNYKKIDLNVAINFPFTIPNGYEEIVLK